MSRPLQSTSSASNNILLKVTVSKRTGRKRKKGSDEPFSGVPVTTVHEQPQRRSAKQLLRSLSDNVGKYKVEPVGLVNRTHVFRGLYGPSLYPSQRVDTFSRHARLCLLDHRERIHQSIPGADTLF